jgi:hypothetical protein
LDQVQECGGIKSIEFSLLENEYNDLVNLEQEYSQMLADLDKESVRKHEKGELGIKKYEKQY